MQKFLILVSLQENIKLKGFLIYFTSPYRGLSLFLLFYFTNQVTMDRPPLAVHTWLRVKATGQSS